MSESVIDQFIGAWRLVSSEFRRSNGELVYPYGRNIQGITIYDHSGYMSLHIMQRHRPNFASGDLQRGTNEEIVTAFRGYVGYFGTFDIDVEEQTVTLHLLASAFPNWVGSNQKRYYKFSTDRLSGKHLTLTTPPTLIDGNLAVGVLVWEHAAGQQPG